MKDDLPSLTLRDVRLDIGIAKTLGPRPIVSVPTKLYVKIEFASSQMQTLKQSLCTDTLRLSSQSAISLPKTDLYCVLEASVRVSTQRYASELNEDVCGLLCFNVEAASSVTFSIWSEEGQISD